MDSIKKLLTREGLPVLTFSVVVFIAVIIGITGPSEIPYDTVSVVGSTQTGVIVDVVDGDTVKIEISDVISTVRLIGIDTPEKEECYYQTATNYLEERVLDEIVRIEMDSTQGDKDKYGRTLGYIFLGSENINNELIELGYASEYTYDKKYKYSGQFEASEALARENEIAIWSGKCAE